MVAVAVADEGVGRRLGFCALDADGRRGDRGGGRWGFPAGRMRDWAASLPGGGVSPIAVLAGGQDARVLLSGASSLSESRSISSKSWKSRNGLILQGHSARWAAPRWALLHLGMAACGSVGP